MKLFPAGVGGPSTVRAFRSVAPELKIVATGGITAGEAGTYLAAGASVIGLGSDLFPERLLVDGDWRAIRDRVERARTAWTNEAGVSLAN